ncbi:MAG: hypothetical protein ABIJ45_08525 [Candidatus Zixiibacteriota bacterium]
MIIFRLLPGVDIPNHLAVSTIYKYIGYPDNLFSQYFKIHFLFKPGVVHTIFCALPIFPSIEFGNHLFFGIYAILLPLSVLLIIRRFNGNIWYSLLAFTLIHHFSCSWGFVIFTMGMPLALLSFYYTLNYLENGSLKNRIILTIFFAFIFFTHALAFLFAMFLYVSTVLYKHRLVWKKLFGDFLIVLPTGIITLIWWFFFTRPGNSETLSQLADYYTGNFIKLYSDRFLDLLKFDNYFLFEGTSGVLVAVLFSSAIILTALIGIILARRQLKEIFKEGLSNIIPVLIAVTFLCFFFLPHGLPGEEYIYQRFGFVFLISLLILGARLLKNRTPLIIKIFIVILTVINIGLWYDYYNDFNRENVNFRQDIFPHNGQLPLAAIIIDYEFRGQPMYIQFQNYYIVWNKGIVTTPIVDYRFGNIGRIVDYNYLPKYHAWVGRHPLSYDKRYNHFGNIIVRGKIPPEIIHRFDGFIKAGTKNGWTLYIRKS